MARYVIDKVVFASGEVEYRIFIPFDSICCDYAPTLKQAIKAKQRLIQQDKEKK